VIAMMIGTALAAIITAVSINAAHAAPKMPVHFRGSWCDAGEHMVRCAEDEAPILVTADGFGSDDYVCHLRRLKPRPDQGYNAKFLCFGGPVNEKPKTARLNYWIGFDNSSALFMRERER
jgi:hypothetical protein